MEVSVRIYSCFLIINGILAPISTGQNQSYVGSEQDGTITTLNVSEVPMDTTRDCSLAPTSPVFKQHITFLIENGAKLIKVNLEMRNDCGPFNGSYVTDSYRPYEWKIVNGYSGKSLLFLKDTFEAMSVHTLSYGVEEVTVELKQEPENCLMGGAEPDIERYIRELLINNMDVEAGFTEAVEVCNCHFNVAALDRKRIGDIVYTCCSRRANVSVECSELERNVWIGFLSQLISILQVLLILLSPLLLPESVYMLKSRFLSYTHQPSSEQPMTLNVMRIEATVTPGDNFEITRRHRFVNLSHLKDVMRRAKHGVVQEFNVNAVNISVRASKIIPDNFAPVGLFDFVKNFLVRCKLRNEVHKDIGRCCNEDMCRMLPCKSRFYWYRCLMYFTGSIVAIICAIPWLLRVWFFYKYEHANIELLKHTLGERNATLTYTGSLLPLLSPTHALFLAIYILLPAECVLFIIIPESLKRKLKFTARKCFREMRDTQKLDACAICIGHMMWPLKHLGIVGCIVWPFWLILLPFSLCHLAFKIFPIINVSLRMLINVVYFIIKTIYPGNYSCITLPGSKFGRFVLWLSRRTQNIIVNTQERNIRGNKLMHACALLMSLITMLMVIILLIECVSFYVRCAVYIIIGIILNSNRLMKYVSLLLLIGLYGHDCFNGVFVRYVCFNKLLNAKVRILVGDKCRKIALLTEEEQNNTAFTIESTNDTSDERMRLVAGSEGYLKWRARRLLLFLDKSDIPRIPKQFMFDISKLPHTCCPGPLHLMYLKAVVEFGLIMIFLMFVFVVILAFGQATDVSSANQTLATLAGGFLPFVFRKLLFKSHESPGLDEDNLRWQGLFSDAVEHFTLRWNFSDIEVSQTKPAANDHLDSSSLNLSTYSAPVDIESERDIVGQITVLDTLQCGERKITTPLLNVAIEQEVVENIDLIVRFRYKNNSSDEIVDYFVPKHHPDKVPHMKDRVDEKVL